MAKIPQIQGYGGKSNGIKSHSLASAKILTGVASKHFGIDLARLPEMSDQELAQYADRAIRMKKLREVLPILEQHFTELIEGQAAYEEFIAGVLKQVDKNGKKIDKAIVDAWLLDRGYTKHLHLLAQKGDMGASLQDAEFRSSSDLNNLDFSTALKIIHLKYQNQAHQIGEKVPKAIHGMQVADKLRQEKEARKDLLTHGTTGKPGGSFIGGVKRFLLG
jgi:hypothetical protein